MPATSAARRQRERLRGLMAASWRRVEARVTALRDRRHARATAWPRRSSPAGPLEAPRARRVQVWALMTKVTAVVLAVGDDAPLEA